jgi:hypothetical protein
LNSSAYAKCLDMVSELRHTIKNYYRVRDAWHRADISDDLYLVALCYFENMSYRLFEDDKNDRLIGLRMAIRLYKRMGKGGNAGLVFKDSHSKTLIVGGVLKPAEEIIRYVSGNIQSSVHTYLAKDFISVSAKDKWRVLGVMLPFMIRQSIACLYKPNRINLALATHEVFEIAYIIHFMKKHRLSELYDWIPYEKDSNFLSLTAIEAGITVTKIPSSGPLITHNRFMLSQKVALSTPYHLDEVDKFKETIRVKQCLMWPPASAMEYADFYEQKKILNKKTLGFFSHASWIRKAQGHAEHGRNVARAEEIILNYLARFVKENPDYTIVIFPHPREKKPDIIDKARVFYSQCLGQANFEILSAQEPTIANFHKAAIGVGAFSSIFYDRMFCGFKVLIGNIGFTDFPMRGSSLNNVCFESYEEMVNLIKVSVELENHDFFAVHNLNGFTKWHRPHIQNVNHG